MAAELKLYAFDSTNTAWELELPTDYKITLNFSLFDLMDISKKQRVYSNTIDLPSTNSNDRFFLSAYDFKSNLFYNHKKHINAYITDDAGFMMGGKLFLISAKKTNNKYSYSVVFIGDAADIIKDLGDSKIRDILITANVLFNFDSSTYINDYSSPNDIGLIPLDYGNDAYFTWLGGSLDGLGIKQTSLVPAIKVNKLIEYIANSVNYSIDSSSDIYGSIFNRLYLIGDNYFGWSNDFAGTKQFVGWNSSNVTHSVSLAAAQSYIQFALYDSTNYTFTNEIYDPNNIHDTSTNKFTLAAGNWKFKQRINGKMTITFVTLSNTFSVGQVLPSFLKLRYDVDDTTNTPVITKYWTNYALIDAKVTNVASFLGYRIVTITSDIDITFDNDINFSTAQTNRTLALSFLVQGNDSRISGFSGNETFVVYAANSNWSIYNNVGAPFGTTNIDAGLMFLPTTKAADVLVDILKSFNLFAIIDPLTRKISIKSFSTFFDTSNIPDVTDLIDNKSYEVVLNNEYQSNNLKLNWKVQNDYYSTKHNELQSLSYGGRIVSNDNEYASSDKDYTSKVISTIAIVDEGDGFVRNAVYIIDKGQKKVNTKAGLRLVLLNGSLSKNTYIDYYTSSGVTISKVAMYSHFDTTDANSWTGNNDGYKTPLFNLNFGFTEINWYSQSGGFFTTNNDIYRNYFYEFNQIYNTNNARILRCTMVIPAELKDILTLRKILFYDGSYWIVNKINSFSEFGKAYNVELVKKFNVELPSVVVPIDTSNNDNTFSTNKLISVGNSGVSLIGENINANRLLVGGNSLMMRNRTFIARYDTAFDLTLTNEVIDSITIIINQLPNENMRIYLNGSVFETITAAKTYTMRKIGITTTDSFTTDTSLGVPVNPLNRQGQITLILQTTKLFE